MILEQDILEWANTMVKLSFFFNFFFLITFVFTSNEDSGARCSSVVRAFAHVAMGRRIDPSWGEPIDLFLIPASAPRLV